MRTYENTKNENQTKNCQKWKMKYYSKMPKPENCLSQNYRKIFFSGFQTKSNS